MIIYVCTAAHANTHRAVAKALPAFRLLPYPRLFLRPSLPRATYIFADFDRLTFWQLELAAGVHRALVEGGCRVLNSPAESLQRLALLRRLHHEGLNSFTAWPATEAHAVDRFPVFLRTGSGHRGNLTELLGNADALDAAIKVAAYGGYPLQDLIVVEYRAEPIRGDVFRKLSMFRIGEAMTPEPSVHERRWQAKFGEDGAAGEDGYAEDLEQVRAMPYAAAALRAFQAANIDYGRIDFGVVAGRPEFYEINTSPTIKFSRKIHDFEDREAAKRFCNGQLLAAIAALDAVDSGGRINIARSGRLRPKDRLWPGYLWIP